ncbi:ABC transporter substrate-binding protein [Catenuloplanes sp. NPDC051500]|uniref:ABC transporter substrate-binding protein n=1 Tax=Catenuloplanes sp. NPDC051500 TaxID=3363959 RepID=UPI0037B85339
MPPLSRIRYWRHGAAIVAAGALTAACTSSTTEGSGGDAGAAITIGTTDQVASLDPAGAWDAGSNTVEREVYSTLVATTYGSTDVKPNLAEVKLTGPTEYTATLKPGLTFVNGHKLTASDVKFSFDRQLGIADENGPSTMLYNLASTTVVDDATVTFTLKSADDVLFPQVLTTAAGYIVDEEVFPADKVLDDDAIVAAKPWNGPFAMDSWAKNSLASFRANPGYQGLYVPKAKAVTLKYYTDASNLKLDVQQGNIDAVYRTLTIPDLQDLGTKSDVKVHTGSGNGIRYIVFNLRTQPFGSKTPDADTAKALAVRQAAANLIDRAQLAEQVYKNTFKPLYSYVPEGITGAAESLKPLYGNKQGGPDAAAAKSVLQAAGITTPVALNLQYNSDHYGSSSEDEYALVKTQLEAGGLFTVSLQSSEWASYGKERVADQYPAYQLGWYADYLDADNYVGSFFNKGNFIANGYEDPTVIGLIAEEQTEPDAAARLQLLTRIQDEVAKQVPVLPLLQGSLAIVTRTSVQGVPEQLDSSYEFRWYTLSKS